MSFEDILIHRDVPIIDRRVAKPPNNPVDYNTIDSLVASPPTVVNLSIGSGRQTGSAFGAQEFVRIDGIRPDEWYATDPMALL